jgi:uncharacterized protein DUF6445
VGEPVKPQLRRVGKSRNPVVIVDEFWGAIEGILKIAESLAPYPPSTNYYPGLRRKITRADEEAAAYVVETCERAGQFIAGAFGLECFDLLEASFSMITTRPSALTMPQRAPHFDTTDQKHLALLHYLRVAPESGTAFYRQRSTGIECVTQSNIDLFVETAKAEVAQLPADSGYIHGSNQFFEEIGAVEALPDRLIIYQGSLLHSSIIPPSMALSTDPRLGRLTANIFVQGS